MSVMLAGVIASITSLLLLGVIGLRDPKRLRTQRIPRQPLTSGARRMLALAALLPGIALMLLGWWSAWLIWFGATLTLGWLVVQWLARGVVRNPQP